MSDRIPYFCTMKNEENGNDSYIRVILTVSVYFVVMLLAILVKHDVLSSRTFEYLFLLGLLVLLLLGFNGEYLNFGPGFGCFAVFSSAIYGLTHYPDSTVAEILIIVVGTLAIFACALWNERLIANELKKETSRRAKSSPYLSVILVENTSKGEINGVIRELETDDKSRYKKLLLSQSGDNDWLISFPDGVSFETFMDVMQDVYLGTVDGTRLELTGYFNSMDALFGDGRIMMKYTLDEGFIYADSTGANYVGKYQRKSIFSRKRMVFIPIEDRRLDYIPLDIESVIKKSRHVKRICIDDSFDVL